ncbi:alpha/beta hydrolase fold [Nocardiopsis flavescens]|uniref:Alpha/beta hydrolase fold n=1 Tax=Nocardiopsis flavescens TaxID=758803 RepID=A0A1M6QUX2_9ACTN|nr:alpha/beta hydrolase [Nocardiopsis flavescens]SHK23837.1 alpha/beta hydrolase fold [Nocardiopsis flavescens]
MRYTAVRGLAGAALLLVTGCTAFPAQEPGEGAGGTAAIDWEPCHGQDEEGALPEDGDPEWTAALECGTLAVPLDHDDPDGETIDIALARVPASGGADRRIGSLVVNPGGPGESGVEMLAYPQFSDGVREAFDLVAFDPRGVGGSGGFACGDWDGFATAQMMVEDPTAVTDAEMERLENSARTYAQACTETVGADFLAEIGTVNVVRDLDMVRAALGDDALTYVGYSYGTYIGALYAEMFPGTTRALVLDGAVETERPNLEVARDQAEAFQATWELFVADCSAGGTCPFSGPEAADEEMTRILDRLDADPPTARGTAVDGATLLGMVGLALYDETSWTELARTLDAVAEGSEESGELLDALYDTTYGLGGEEEDAGEGDGTGGEQEGGAYLDAEAALTAVNCADRVDPTDPGAYRDAAEAIAEQTPFFGPDLVWGQLPCAYWPDTDTAPTGFTAADAPPLVVVGTVGDPATPYAWAEELAGQLETATLVTYEGAGHTVYGYGLPCVDDPIDAYLLEERVPDAGLSCPAL